MKFSYNWLKEIGKFKDAPQELAEFLTLRVFEVESVEKKAGDWILDIKILPNRMSDASGHEGMAREISVLKNRNFRQIANYKSQMVEGKKKISKLLKVKIENPDDCPRYTARIMEGVMVEPSPKWLKERLETCGLQSINNIVDAANYVMLELGQPLHVFDYDKLDGKKILVRRAKKGEKIPALDDKTYDLSPEILVIADQENPIAVAGTKGGKYSGVSDRTKTIVLEAANFNQIRIRVGSQTLGINTDASIRFSHGMDPNETLRAINRLAEVIQKAAGGKIIPGAIDVYQRKRKETSILLRPDYANRLIGANLSQGFYSDAIKRLGWKNKSSRRGIIVNPPSNRLDIEIEEDVIEEAARILGYENIKPRLPDIAMAPSARNDELLWEDRIKENLAGAGFTEHEPYEFTGDKELSLFSLDASQSLELENPTNPETKYMVPRVLIKFAGAVAENLRNQESVRIFGIAKSFCKNSEKRKDLKSPYREPYQFEFPYERKDLVICLAQKGSSGEEEFYQLKGALDQLFEQLGINDLWYDDALDYKPQATRLAEDGEARRANYKLFHPYRFAEVKINEEKIGTIGEIHPAILENLKTKIRIAAAEIDFEKLWRAARAEQEFRPIGKYPAIVRDIAVVVPSDAKADEVQEIIENIGGNLLVDSDLFDYFQDGQMRESEQKSLAFHLIFQSPERTLKDGEVNSLVEKIIKSLEEKDWEVRK